MKKILVVFPENFLRNHKGCTAYVYNIVKYLKTKNCQIDFFCLDIYNDAQNDFDVLNRKNNNLITNFYHYPQTYCNKNKKNYNISLFNKLNIFQKNEEFNYIKYNIFGIKITYKKKLKYKYNPISSPKNDYIVDEFNRIVNENRYDIIHTHHIMFSFLLDNIRNKNNSIFIHAFQDLAFLQHFYNFRFDSIDKVFLDEIKTINLFDKIFCVSSDEALFISRFYNNKEIEFIPHISEEVILEDKNKTIDLLFIGANNPYNAEAIIWFLKNVYTKLNDINITICGAVQTMPYFKENIKPFINNKNINFIDFAENLDDLYSIAKIVIVPMFRGTGLKIKTIEAMARGIPIVSSLLGVDGLEDKRESGCLVVQNADEFIYYINKLLENKEFYNETKNKIRSYFNKYLSLKANEKKLNKIFGLEDIK